MADSWRQIERAVVECRKCPRLVAWRERVGREKKRSYAAWTYWSKPVPGHGDREARVLVVGLAPAAHGANRTGRMFTGDESGRWLLRAMHRAGFANQAESVQRGDGLALEGAYITSAVRCAPPKNRPTPREITRCLPYLAHEVELLPELRTVVCLGSIAWRETLRALELAGFTLPHPRPRFRHGAEIDLGSGAPRILACYHPSQQNTFTRRLTEPMLDAVFARAREISGS